jgi:hypothetical protein
MAIVIRQVNYFTTTVRDEPGEAYKLLSTLAELGVNLLAFTAIPTGNVTTQLTLFPEDSPQLTNASAKAGLLIQGPQKALLVQGDDQLGALAGIHEKLYEEKVNVYASSGVTDGKGSFGYVLYIRPDEFQRAVKALGL